MAAIDFPSAPTLNQEVTLAGVTYAWNGQGWIAKAGTPGGGGVGSGNVTGPISSIAGHIATFADITGKVIQDSGTLPIPPGTRMIFVQPVAPVGWTQILGEYEDRGLRLSDLPGASAGSLGFATLFARTATDPASLDASMMPSHAHHLHLYQGLGNMNGNGYIAGNSGTESENLIASATSGQLTMVVLPTGGNSPHSHGLDMRLKYADAMVCSKD